MQIKLSFPNLFCIVTNGCADGIVFVVQMTRYIESRLLPTKLTYFN